MNIRLTWSVPGGAECWRGRSAHGCRAERANALEWSTMDEQKEKINTAVVLLLFLLRFESRKVCQSMSASSHWPLYSGHDNTFRSDKLQHKPWWTARLDKPTRKMILWKCATAKATPDPLSRWETKRTFRPGVYIRPEWSDPDLTVVRPCLDQAYDGMSVYVHPCDKRIQCVFTPIKKCPHQ